MHEVSNKPRSDVDRRRSDAGLLRAACRIHTDLIVHRYLMSCSEGRLDGHEKAMRHHQLCAFYVAVWFDHSDPDVAARDHDTAYTTVHETTQQLTDFLDEVIGFPISGTPDYDRLVPLFFEAFHDLALKALGTLDGSS